MIILLSDLYFPTTIIYGAGSLQRLREAANTLNVKHLFIILSRRAKKDIPFLVRLETTTDLTLTFFTDFSKEPTTDDLNLAIKHLRESGADCIVALGGGTPIDLAKAVSVLAKQEELTIQNLHNQKQLQRYPLIAIPTTSGTGSEVTKITVITDIHSSFKYNPAHPRLIPDIAILDPELTISLPTHITAQTGIDALAHAMEAYVSTLANPISDMFALEAMKLIRTYLHRAYHSPTDLEARDGMLRASCYAGLAFSNASTNLAHATARPLGARFHLPHGLSVSLTLPPVIAFGSEVMKKRYDEIAILLGTNTLDYVMQANRDLGIYEQARNMIKTNRLMKAIPILTEDALSGNGIMTNAKIPTEQDIKNIYEHIVNNLMEG